MVRDQGSGVGDQGKDEVKKKSPSSKTISKLTSDPRSPTPESGGPKGKEPTRYGDWEINGKCVDF